MDEDNKKPKNVGGDELNVREATILSLERSHEEFENLRKSFQVISEHFDAGRDAEGLTQIVNEVIPKIEPLQSFCFTLGDTFAEIIGEELLDELIAKVNAVHDIVETLEEETENGNFTEVGDILRFDFYDLVNELDSLFPKMTQKFKDSSDERLSQI